MSGRWGMTVCMRFVRRVAAMLSMLGLASAPLQALQGCMMPDAAGMSGMRAGAVDGMDHAHHAPGDDMPGAPTTPDGDRCPDLMGCSPTVAPLPAEPALASIALAPSVPIVRASGPRTGPAAALEPPPPRR